MAKINLPPHVKEFRNMDGNELMELDDFGAMAKAFRNDDVESLMEMTDKVP